MSTKPGQYPALADVFKAFACLETWRPIPASKKLAYARIRNTSFSDGPDSRKGEREPMTTPRLVPPRVSTALWTTAIGALLFSVSAFVVGEKTGLAEADPGAGGARNLMLAPNLSFTDDSSPNFPIRAENIDDGRIASDRPTAIFFGTSHCWNTAREAERFVALYAKEKDAARFVVVDLDHASADQRALVSRFYRGYIPTLAFLDRAGNVVYNDAGETSSRRGDTSKLEELLEKAKRGVR